MNIDKVKLRHLQLNQFKTKMSLLACLALEEHDQLFNVIKFVHLIEEGGVFVRDYLSTFICHLQPRLLPLGHLQATCGIINLFTK